MDVPGEKRKGRTNIRARFKMRNIGITYFQFFFIKEEGVFWQRRKMGCDENVLFMLM